MTLQQLKYVITVAETGTITEAANKLYISQPSLTNAIHEWEKEMNIVIFNRTNKGISLPKDPTLQEGGMEEPVVPDVPEDVVWPLTSSGARKYTN